MADCGHCARPEWCVARGVQQARECPFRHDATLCRLVIDRFELSKRPLVIGPSLHEQSPLSGSRHELAQQTGRLSGATKTLEARLREDESIDLTSCQLAKPRVDVAAQLHDLDVLTQRS